MHFRALKHESLKKKLYEVLPVSNLIELSPSKVSFRGTATNCHCTSGWIRTSVVSHVDAEVGHAPTTSVGTSRLLKLPELFGSNNCDNMSALKHFELIQLSKIIEQNVINQFVKRNVNIFYANCLNDILT